MIPKELPLEVKIPDVKLQMSTKDAGPIEVSTYIYINGQKYLLDQTGIDNSLDLVPAPITPNGPIRVTDPKVWGSDSSYTISFDHVKRAPKGGYYEIMVPK